MVGAQRGSVLNSGSLWTLEPDGLLGLLAPEEGDLLAVDDQVAVGRLELSLLPHPKHNNCAWDIFCVSKKRLCPGHKKWVPDTKDASQIQ